MNDSYQAIYDATRSRLSNCDVGQAVRDAVALEVSGLSRVIENIGHEYTIAAMAHRAAALTEQLPHVLMRPRVFPDGNAWCALYGDNIQEGVCGFGDTPAAAASAFDTAWQKERAGP